MSYDIYLLEDEKNLNQLLTQYLKNEGWQVKSFFKGLDAGRVIIEKPDFWILDIMLPDIDGYQLLAEIKKTYPKTPVIFISARDADLDRVIGLEKGCGDYLAKTFSPRELVIRTKKILGTLSYFLKNTQHSLSRQQILRNVRDDYYIGPERVVDDLVRRLRKKMPEIKIETVYGYDGYRLVTA